MKDTSFEDAFVEHMEAMGLPVPSTIFATASTAVASASAIIGALQLVGPRVTLAQLSASFGAVASGAGTAGVAVALGELAVVAGACAASLYVGAVIGSLVCAAWRSNAKEMGMVLTWARQQCQRLDTSLLQLVRRASHAVGMGWNNLLELLT